jgi:hypothetical protein
MVANFAALPRLRARLQTATWAELYLLFLN